MTILRLSTYINGVAKIITTYVIVDIFCGHMVYMVYKLPKSIILKMPVLVDAVPHNYYCLYMVIIYTII